jgi:hypothetical protein
MLGGTNKLTGDGRFGNEIQVGAAAPSIKASFSSKGILTQEKVKVDLDEIEAGIHQLLGICSRFDLVARFALQEEQNGDKYFSLRRGSAISFSGQSFKIFLMTFSVHYRNYLHFSYFPEFRKKITDYRMKNKNTVQCTSDIL